MEGTAQTNSSTAVRVSRAQVETRFSSIAMAKPISRLSATFTTVNTTVRASTVQNVESDSTRL